MGTIYYVHPDGKFAGGWIGELPDPSENHYLLDGCIEIGRVTPPESGLWYWDFSSSSWYLPPPPDSEVAAAVRSERDRLLREVYDPGINMALRALRVSSSPEESSYATGKIAELDAYAVALTGIPEQSGFPQNVTWPETPAP